MTTAPAPIIAERPTSTPGRIVALAPIEAPLRTDRGHEFQALFHWHVADKGMEHVYIKPRTPQLMGKVERSHRTDKTGFMPSTAGPAANVTAYCSAMPTS